MYSLICWLSNIWLPTYHNLGKCKTTLFFSKTFPMMYIKELKVYFFLNRLDFMSLINMEFTPMCNAVWKVQNKYINLSKWKNKKPKNKGTNSMKNIKW